MYKKALMLFIKFITWPPHRGGWQKSLIFDWGSVPLMIRHSLRPESKIPATSLREGGKRSPARPL